MPAEVRLPLDKLSALARDPFQSAIERGFDAGQAWATLDGSLGDLELLAAAWQAYREDPAHRPELLQRIEHLFGAMPAGSAEAGVESLAVTYWLAFAAGAADYRDLLDRGTTPRPTLARNNSKDRVA